MKRISLVAIVVGFSLVGGCKKKAAEGGDGSASGSSMGSDMGSGSAMMGSGSGSGSAAMAGSGSGSGSAAMAGSGSGSGGPSGFATLITDDTNGNREADLKTAADKAVAALPADLKGDAGFGVQITLKKLDTAAKVACDFEIIVMTMPGKEMIATLKHNGEVTPEKGKEADAPAECFEGVLEHSFVEEVTKAVAAKKAGKPFVDDDAGSGSGSAKAGSGSGSAAPAKKK